MSDQKDSDMIADSNLKNVKLSGNLDVMMQLFKNQH